MFINKFNTESQMLLNMNKYIHKNKPAYYGYHMNHILLTWKYALLIINRLKIKCNKQKMQYACFGHDLFKEHGLDPNIKIVWESHDIPTDLNWYVRTNLDILELYGLDEYFNTDINLHGLAAGIFIHKEFNIRDKEILYPIFFHSCPIISVYETLSRQIQNMVDVMILADKLSSNYLKINMHNKEVRIDLDQIVFGLNGNEFNYTLGLFLARLIGHNKSQEEQSILSTKYYHKRLCEQNPLIGKQFSIKKLGGNILWPQRPGVLNQNNLPWKVN